MCNKPSRIEKIVALLEDVMQKGSITIRDAQVIHGNLNFAMGFFLGHTLKVAARAFAFLSTEDRRFQSEDLVDLCSWTIDLMKTILPKHVEPGTSPESILLFTDAAYENGRATWGIVLLDGLNGTRMGLGGDIPQELVQAWHGMGVEQVIT